MMRPSPAHSDKRNHMMHTDIYERITQRIIDQLQNGVVAWRRPWRGGRAANLVSRRPYRGVNVLSLATAPPYASRYWLTFKQAQGMGGTVRRGEHGCPIIYSSTHQRETTTDNGDKEITAYGFMKLSTVFNIEQCDGIATPSDDHRADLQPIEAAAQVIASMPDAPRILHNGGARAFYRPATDSVHMPLFERFDSAESYYAVMFHELAHATGHESRIGRESVVTRANFASDPYCREELIAEMTAAMLCGVVGIEQPVIENSAAYIDSWLRELANDHHLIFDAASQAQKAADYILDVSSDTEQAA